MISEFELQYNIVVKYTLFAGNEILLILWERLG